MNAIRPQRQDSSEHNARVIAEITKVVRHLRGKGRFQGSRDSLDLAHEFFAALKRRPSGAQVVMKVATAPEGEWVGLLWTSVRRFLIDWRRSACHNPAAPTRMGMARLPELDSAAYQAQEEQHEFALRGLWLRAELEMYERGETTSEPDAERRRRQVRSFLLHLEDRSIRDIAAEMGVKKNVVERWTKMLEDHLKARALALEEG